MFQGVHFHSLLGDTDYFIYCQYIKFINERATCKACFAIEQYNMGTPKTKVDKNIVRCICLLPSVYNSSSWIVNYYLNFVTLRVKFHQIFFSLL